jgi:putative transcriptional regulator
MPAKKKFNRIKVVLATKEKTAVWLAERLGKDVVTVSRWNRNVQQPSLESLFEIARLLEVDVCELVGQRAARR